MDSWCYIHLNTWTSVSYWVKLVYIRNFLACPVYTLRHCTLLVLKKYTSFGSLILQQPIPPSTNCYLPPPLRSSLLGCPCICKKFFGIGWDLIGKPKDILWQLFLIRLAFSVESCICDGLTGAVSQSYINRSRQIDVNWSRVWHGLASLEESCICDSGTITVS